MSKESYKFTQRDNTIAGVGAAAVAVVLTKIIKARRSKENEENPRTADAKSRAAEKQEA